MSRSRAEQKMIKYLKPWKFIRVTRSKLWDYYNPVFLGLSFTDKYVRLAISDDSLSITSIYGGFPIDDTLLDKLVDVVHSLQNDSVEKYELLGIVVADNNSVAPPVNIHNLMDNLWEKGNLKSLKYTCWKDDFVYENPTCECKALRNSFPVVKHQGPHERREEFSAEYMLQEIKDEDEEREAEDEEMEDYERKKQCKIIQ